MKTFPKLNFSNSIVTSITQYNLHVMDNVKLTLLLIERETTLQKHCLVLSITVTS